MKPRKNKHLTLDERIEIQESLTHGVNFKTIAQRIGKDQTTISKEVKRHIITHTNSFVNTDKPCPLLLKAPYVCNGCERRSRTSCHYQRQLYSARAAQKSYETLLVESREGIPLNKESFYQTEKIISEGIAKGQHIYHILKSANLPISKSTVYRHINKQYYSIGRIDLPRAVKFKPRYSNNVKYVPKCVKKGRTYDDFAEFISQNEMTAYVEMDTVIGRIGGKVILTLHFTAFNFMLGILLENKTAAETALKIKELKERLHDAGFVFGDIMPVILTDNGGEFSNVQAFENNLNGEKETELFYCDANMPSQKPRIEKNHTLFRDIVPKGSSFDEFSQETLNLIFSHVNSVKRAVFNGKSPYELFTFAYSETLAEVLGISYVKPQNVIQSPKLLK